MEAHMKYMLLICRDEPAWDRLSVTERQQIYRQTLELSEELTSRGQYLGGFPLHPSSSATSVRRSEKHTSELQSLAYLVCRLLLEKKKHTSELQSLAYLVCRIIRSEEHTSELQSLAYLVCRLMIEKKKSVHACWRPPQCNRDEALLM